MGLAICRRIAEEKRRIRFGWTAVPGGAAGLPVKLPEVEE